MVLIEIINYSLTCWRPASYTFFSTITIIDPISVSVQGKIECGCLKRLNLAAILGRYKQIYEELKGASPQISRYDSLSTSQGSYLLCRERQYTSVWRKTDKI